MLAIYSVEEMRIDKTGSVCSIDFIHIPRSARGETGICLTILRHLVELYDWCSFVFTLNLFTAYLFFLETSSS